MTFTLFLRARIVVRQNSVQYLALPFHDLILIYEDFGKDSPVGREAGAPKPSSSFLYNQNGIYLRA